MNVDIARNMEMKYTKNLMAEVAKMAQSEETTAATIAALANSLVIYAIGGTHKEEEAIETISLAVNRAIKYREKMKKALNMQIISTDPKTHEKEKR